MKDPPKFTKIGIFCLKIYHLATLVLIKLFRPIFIVGEVLGFKLPIYNLVSFLSEWRWPLGLKPLGDIHTN
jgi:hypothetical protein